MALVPKAHLAPTGSATSMGLGTRKCPLSLAYCMGLALWQSLSSVTGGAAKE